VSYGYIWGGEGGGEGVLYPPLVIHYYHGWYGLGLVVFCGFGIITTWSGS
jgi:hypothetical protein